MSSELSSVKSVKLNHYQYLRVLVEAWVASQSPGDGQKASRRVLAMRKKPVAPYVTFQHATTCNSQLATVLDKPDQNRASLVGLGKTTRMFRFCNWLLFLFLIPLHLEPVPPWDIHAVAIASKNCEGHGASTGFCHWILAGPAGGVKMDVDRWRSFQVLQSCWFFQSHREALTKKTHSSFLNPWQLWAILGQKPQKDQNTLP